MQSGCIYTPGYSEPGDLGLAVAPLALLTRLICLLFAGSLVSTADARDVSPPAPSPRPNAKAPPAAGAQAHVPWPRNRYLCFSNMASVVAIRVSASEQVVRVGASATVPLNAISALTDAQAKPAAGELGVPTGLIVRTAQLVSQDPSASAEQFAQQLETAVIDFRFLLAELSCYHPPPDEEPARKTALLDLVEGDLPRVWEYYRALRWPHAPSQLVKAP